MFWMKSWKVLAVMALAMVAIGMSAWGGPVPQRINYQGTLNNKSGGPANGTFNMTFRIYSTATGTSPLWTETWNTANSSPVVVTDGVFNVMLGSLTPLSNDFFATYPKTYLGVSVANDSEFLPRQMIASVGYAFAAGNGVPKGGIIMWSGTTVPEGWALCDGSNGTPNLRDRFIVGAGSGYAVGASGGEATHVLTTNELPAHNHPVNPPSTQTGGQTADHSHTVNGSGGTDNSDNSTYVRTDNQGGQHPPTGGASNDHAHWVDIAQFNSGDTGSGVAHENRPPYYALAFIMKL